MKDKEEILALTGLRFIAAFYVFLFHIHIRWPITSIKFLNNILGQGAIGMSLFFILSGFVLAYRYADGRTSLRTYLFNRFARIYPIYIVAALVTLPWIGLSLENGSILEVSKAIVQGTLLIFANIFLIQAWFPHFFDYWNDSGSWSISVEAFCYILLPSLLPLLVRLPIKRVTFLALVCYVLVVLPGLVDVIFPGTLRAVYYSMPIYRFPEFLIGVCCYLTFQNWRTNRFNQWQQLAFLGLVILYLGLLGSKISNYIGHNWLVIPFIVYMTFTLAYGKGVLASLLSAPFFVWLGKISYCFYSFQTFVIFSSISYHDQIVSTLPFLINNKIFLLFLLVILIIISGGGYYLIEEPARRRIRQVYTDVLQKI